MLDRSEHADFTEGAKPILRGVFPYSRQPTELASVIAAKAAASCDRAGRADPTLGPKAWSKRHKGSPKMQKLARILGISRLGRWRSSA